MDKKSDHYTSAQSYTDLDGQSRQFTFVDHDKKPSVSFNTNTNFKDMNVEYRASLLQRITDLPAAICPELFVDFTVRGEGKKVVEWNTDMLLDKGVPLSQLRDLCTLVENKGELMKLTP